MAIRRLIPFFALPLVLLSLLFFAGVGRAAPLPKGTAAARVSDQEVPAEPVEATKIQATTYRLTSSNNLKQFALAAINFSDANRGNFPRNVTDKDGKPLLSWRVQILPYIEAADLHNAFRMDEAWDSEHNLKLLERMPKVFSSPRVLVNKKGYTVYQGFEGAGAAFERGKQLRFPASFSDGTSNTIMLVESSIAVPWTKPVDLPFDPKKDVIDFGKAYGGKPLTVLCDGSVRTLDLKNLSQETLKNAITTAGGEVLGADWK